MRRHTADGVHSRMADEGIIIRAIRLARIIPGQLERRTTLPPAVLGVDNARVELWFETRPSPYASVRRGKHRPVPSLNAALGGRCRMQFHLRGGHKAPQARPGAVLTMAKTAAAWHR
jgi:hypothetical protein